MAGNRRKRWEVRFVVDCDILSNEFCGVFREFLGMKGLKTLFFHNLFQEMCGDTEKETKRRLTNILMGNFKIVFTDDYSEAKPQQAGSHSSRNTKLDEIREEFKQFSDKFADAILKNE